MTLERSAGPVQYELDAPPAGGLEEVKTWTREMLLRLLDLQAQPRVQSVMLVRVESASDPVLLRPGEGMLIYAAVNVVGAGKPIGFYAYVGGVWKQLTMA